jgi:hypothetical protein
MDCAVRIACPSCSYIKGANKHRVQLWLVTTTTPALRDWEPLILPSRVATGPTSTATVSDGQYKLTEAPPSLEGPSRVGWITWHA